MHFFAWIISKWSSLKKYAMVGRPKGQEEPLNGAQSPYGAICFYGVEGPLVAIGWTLMKLKFNLATYSSPWKEVKVRKVGKSNYFYKSVT